MGWLFLAAFTCMPAAIAQTVGVAWDPNPAADEVTGYNVYHGVTGSFTNKLVLGNQTSTTVSGLQPAQTYFFYVTAVNAYGESDPSEVVEYRLNTPPVAFNLDGQIFANQTLSVTLVGSDADGDALSYQVVAGPGHGSLNGAGSIWSYTPAGGYSGPDSFTYKVNDGKVDSNVATVSISVLPLPDIIAPLVAITAPAQGSVVSGIVTITVGASDNVALSRVDLFRNGVLVGTAPTAPASFTWDTRTAANGTWTLQAKAYDLVANPGVSSLITVTVQNDTTPPSVMIQSPAAGSTVSGVLNISVAATDDFGVNGIQLFVNGNLAGSAASSPASFSWDTKTVADGTLTLLAKATDLAGNQGLSASVSVTVQNTADTTAPYVRVINPKAASTVSGTTDIQVTATDDVIVTKVKCFIDGSVIGTSTSPISAFAWDTTKYANGTYIVQAQAFDAAGNSSAVSVPDVVVSNSTTTPDTTLPVVAITAPASAATVWGTIGVTIQATDDRGLTMAELYLDGNLISSSASGFTTFSLNTATVANGSHTIEVRGYDAAGNVGFASLPVNVQNATTPTDTTPPSVVITSPRDGSVTKKNFSVKISSSDNVAVTRLELYIDGNLYGSSTSATASFSVNPNKLSAGYHALSAKAYDAAGNVGTSSPVTIRR